MRLCLVGCGRWGQAYLNTVKSIPSLSIEWIVVNKTIPKLVESYKYSYDLDKLLEKKKIDGVIIATPPDTHFNLASICVKHSIPVLVEKPFTISYEQSENLKKQFYKKKLLCMIGYQQLYSKKHKLLKKQIKDIGKIKNIISIAISDGPFRRNVSVIRDWGSHEIATALDLFGELPQSAEIKIVKNNYTNIYKALYCLKMKFSKKRKFNSFFGNQSAFKKKQLIIECTKGSILQDNLSTMGNLKILKGNFFDLKKTLEINPTPLEDSLREFQRKLNNNYYFSNINLCLRVNKILDQLENGLKLKND